MYELVQVGESTYYIDCPAKMGLVRCDGQGVLLIDSGNDKEAGKKVQKILDSRGWALRMILNTHSNADHIGGNQLLQQRLGCPVYAPGLEAAFVRYPHLEPSFLYGGYPGKALRNKFLMAQPSDARPLEEAALPPGMEVLPLPGHFFDMVGFKSPDGVWFLADCLNGEAILEKYHISFLYDVQAYLETLELVSALEGRLFVPAHAGAAEDIRPLVQRNRDKVLEVAEKIVEICREPLCFEDILQRLFEAYGLVMDFNQYVLVGSTVRSYLSWLLDGGRLRAEFVQSRLLWRGAGA